MEKRNLIEKLKDHYQKKYDTIYNPRAVKAALYYAKQYGFDSGNKSTYNNEADAFKHTFASALVSCEENYIISLGGGYYHEWSNSSNNEGEYRMDTHNNGVGRQIAREIKKDYGDKWNAFTPQTKDKIIAERVWQKMKEGKIILDPSGRTKLKKENRKTKSDSAKTKCVGSYPVSGYTRANGTEVKGYTRTCGAKHSSNNNYSSKYAPESPVSVEDSKSDKPDDIPAIIMTEKERVLKKYKDKKAQDLSKSEIDEFLKAIWG